MPGNDLALLVEAAQAAGQVATRYFQSDLTVEDKPGGAGPVTQADLEVDTLLRETLTKARPDYGWLSEETPDTTDRLHTGRQFVVDPIDGTRAFIDEGQDWAHSLAVVEDGVPIATVVYLPVRHLLFVAAKGEGAKLNEAPIKVSDGIPPKATVLASRPNMDAKHWKKGGPPQVERTFRSSLAFRLSLVGQGRFDAMLTLRPSWEWDIAAGALIVSEAGGTITDQSGHPLIFNNPHPQVPGVVAGGSRLHAQILDRLEPVSPKL